MTRDAMSATTHQPYPSNGHLSELLRWHMDIGGTRPDGSPDVPGVPWTISELSFALDKSTTAEPESQEKRVKRWRSGRHRMAQTTFKELQSVLFGESAAFEAWRRDFLNAWRHFTPLTSPSNQIDEAEAQTNASSRCNEEQSVSTRPILSPTAAQLADCMMEISQRCWHAGWFRELEYSLWDAIETGPRDYGQGHITGPQIEILKALSDACGGWIFWKHETYDSDGNENFDDVGPTWVPMPYWLKHWDDPERFGLHSCRFPDPTLDSQRRLIYGFVDDPDRSDWKREALFFDRIVLPDALIGLDPDDWYWDGHQFWDDGQTSGPAAQQLVQLVRRNVIIPAELMNLPQGELENALYNELVELDANDPRFDYRSARLRAMMLNRRHGVEALPVFEQLPTMAAHVNPDRESVLRLVFGRLPIPDPEVSWDQIIAYREDPESKRRFAALRHWINRIVRSEIPPHEAIDELEHLIGAFEAHVRRHRMPCGHAPFGTCVTATADDCLRLRGQLGSRFAQVKVAPDDSGIFTDFDANAPGSEVAYLCVTRKVFA